MPPNPLAMCRHFTEFCPPPPPNVASGSAPALTESCVTNNHVTNLRKNLPHNFSFVPPPLLKIFKISRGLHVLGFHVVRNPKLVLSPPQVRLDPQSQIYMQKMFSSHDLVGLYSIAETIYSVFSIYSPTKLRFSEISC